jgi:hypothetical protein
VARDGEDHGDIGSVDLLTIGDTDSLGETWATPITLANLVYNIDRLILHERRAAMG